MPFNPHPVRMNTRKAADFIGCAPFTVKRARTTGTLLGHPAPVFRKLGRKVVYDREVLETWLEQFEPRRNTAA